MASERDGLVGEIKQAFRADDAERVRQLLELHPELKRLINEPLGPFDSPAIVNVRSPGMLDVLLDAGADVNARSRWWAGGFGLLDSASPELAAYAIERGAVVDAHAAARLGLMERLAELVAADPAVVHERGGDGQTPLHFASTVEVVEYLLGHGAAIDALDVDHESTPAQYMVGDRHDVARHLVSRGCRTDILMASALGDVDPVRRHLDADSACIRMRVDNEFFPMANPKAGGTIYNWTLGFHLGAHQVARKFGHEDVLRLLLDRSPEPVRLLAACWLGDEQMVRSLLANQPEVSASLSEAERHQVAHAARNNDATAVRLMLLAGLPAAARGQHRGTPLHWAAYHGNAEMVRSLLESDPPLDVADNEFDAPPIGWAIHGSEHGWYCRTGDYAATVDALLQAGAKRPERIAGSDPVRAVLRRHGVASPE